MFLIRWPLPCVTWDKGCTFRENLFEMKFHGRGSFMELEFCGVVSPEASGNALFFIGGLDRAFICHLVVNVPAR